MDGELLSQRTVLATVPYGFKSGEADHAIYADTADYSRVGAPDIDWTVSGNDMYSSVTGNVGIGTASPDHKLHVGGGFAANTVNTGQGDYELYDMNQNVRTTDSPTFATLNTGQGANELYGMDQNVTTTSNVAFNRSYLNDYGYALGGLHVGGTSDPGTDNLIVDGNVGIGTTSPSTKLQVQGSTTIHDRFKFSQNGYWADFDLYTGHPSGWPRLHIYETPGGGSRTQTGLLNAGVLTMKVLQGITDSNSDDAVGVYGEAITTSSANVFGVKGISHSTTNNSTGSTAGVYGLNDRTGAVGDVFGVLGEIRGAGGAGPEPNFAAGVYGISYSTTGRSAGIWGDSQSSDPNGAGVIGKNRATSGSTRGVWGEVSSSSGKGVYGRAPSGGYAIWGEEPAGGSGASIYADGDLIVDDRFKFGQSGYWAFLDIYTSHPSSWPRFYIYETQGGGSREQTAQYSHGTLTLDGEIHANGTGNNWFQGDVGIGTTSPSYKLDVEGDIQCVTLHETSDDRLKTNIIPLSNTLEKVVKLRGISFEWNDEAESVGATAGEKQIGVLASEVEQVFPELVSSPDDGYKSVDYTKLTAVLIEAVKELKTQNEILQKEVELLKAHIN